MTFGNGWLFGIVCGVLINALLIALVIIVEILIDKIKELGLFADEEEDDEE